MIQESFDIDINDKTIIDPFFTDDFVLSLKQKLNKSNLNVSENNKGIILNFLALKTGKFHFFFFFLVYV